MSAEAQATTEAIPVQQMPLVKTEIREVHRPLTAEERVEKDHDMHRLKREILEEEESLKSYTKERKGAIAKLETERDALIEVGEKGRSEWVDCEIRLDQERGLRLIVRADTLEVVTEEPMTYADRQPCLFPATLEDGAPRVPVSRQVREAFVSTLGGEAGERVQKLHADGFLDPTDWEIESMRRSFLDFEDDDTLNVAPQVLRDNIADAESNLDEDEATLAQILADSELDESSVIAIAINSRTPEASRTDDEAGVWDKLLEVRDARAAIDFCHGELMRATAEATEPSDRTEALEAVAGEATPVRRTSRELRDIPIADRTERQNVDEYWAAHHAGILDPTENELTRARADIGEAGLSEHAFAQLSTDLDATEQDCAAEIKTSAKARMALSRGTFPTKAVKVDTLIGEVRWLRAKLDVALEAEANA